MIASVQVQIDNGILDKTRPASLARYITKEEWASLAWDIENALLPGLRFNRIFSTLMFGIPCAVMVLYILFATISYFRVKRIHDDYVAADDDFPYKYHGAFDSGSVIFGYVMFGFFVFVFTTVISISVLSLLFYIVRFCGVDDSVRNNLDTVIMDFSDRNRGGVSLHVKENVAYFPTHGGKRSRLAGRQGVPVDYTMSVSVDEGVGYVLEEHSDGRNNTRCSDNGGGDLKSRLEELEQARAYLSDAEYQQKRQAILESV
eukprot:CAMPEP_0119572478 /NCGR_PEP_ID=MMETSP1352-20130426/44642_1 /TAXON_ID=265584 /ORGANISM="Stauroneis constricta, Strain CCMP1120" /LENGTH=258 /DNA_ID=CAMNT_0007622163 /DNA_START=643 /DNA_END=1419 /DNA_ORIENTATION=-